MNYNKITLIAIFPGEKPNLPPIESLVITVYLHVRYVVMIAHFKQYFHKIYNLVNYGTHS